MPRAEKREFYYPSGLISQKPQSNAAPMIRDVYVLKRTGEVLVHKAFSKRGVDEAIFSGFYSALSAFAEELGHGGIETIQMGDVSFYYEHSENLLFAIASDKSHEAKDVKIILTEVKRQFADKYADHVANWDGNPAPFQKFTKDIELIISSKRSSNGEDTLFVLPFALDGTKLKGKNLEDPEINGDCILDSRLELAAVHLLLDDIRQADTGLKPIKEGCYEFIAKILWPIWIVKSPDNRLVLIDGLHLLRPQVSRGFVPPASRYEALLKVNASPDYLAVMDKLTEEVRTAARSTPIEIHVLPPELTHLIQQLSRIMNGKDQFGVQLPSRLNHGQATKEAEQFLTEAIQTYKEASDQWTKFRLYFQTDVQKWQERIQTEITTLESHFDTRKTELKQEIDKALTTLAKQEEKAKAEVEGWQREQKQKRLAPLKAQVESLHKEITQQDIALDPFLPEKKSSALEAETFIDKLNQTLDQFSAFASNLRDHTKETRKQIQQSQKNLDEINRQALERQTQVRQRFETQEKQEIKRLDTLQEEREIRLNETKQRLKHLEAHASEIDGLIQEHIVHTQEQLTKYEKYLSDTTASLPEGQKIPVYIPVYLAGLKREDTTTKLIVIPPLMVPPAKPTASQAIGQRSAPVGALSDAMISYLKEPLENALATDQKFAKEVTRFSPRHNLLADPHVESLLYSGLHALWQSKLIPERIHTQVKLACIDMYRSANGNS